MEQLLPLVNQVLPMARRMLENTALAEDAVQEVMLSLWEKRKALKIETSHSAFLYKAVRNRCLDVLKRQQDTQALDTVKELQSAVSEDFDTMQWIHKCIAELPEVQQQIVVMREIDGLEFKEISELLCLKEAHVRVLLSRAKKTLQEVIPKGLE